jgi:microcystin-dependent protein
VTDFNTPGLGDYFEDVLDILKGRDVSCAKMAFDTETNIPTSTLRYNRTNRVLEEWNGSAWVEKRTEPPGLIKMYGGSSAPRGHLMCDGTAYSRTTYADLFAIIGTSYGAGDGSTTFNVPDYRQRFPLGKAASGTGSTLGGTGGTIDHGHSVPKHYHGMGTGSDLNITSSGTHTTNIDIAHGHTASASSSLTGISATTSYTNITINDPGHGHNYGAREGGSNGSDADRPQGAASSTGSNVTYSTNNASTGITLNDGNHGHEVYVSDSGHGHTITVDALGSTNKTDTSGVHVHASGNFAGRIGIVTGGVDGNADMTSGTNNPPFLVSNFVITI